VFNISLLLIAHCRIHDFLRFSAGNCQLLPPLLVQVNEGAEEIGKGGAQENEVDETEIDGADTWVSLPDQTLI